MSHIRSLNFEALETREFLSTGHARVAHDALAAVAVRPIVLDGTLAVDNKPNAGVTNVNMEDSTTTSTPVAGHLATLGEVRGVWNKTQDVFGDPHGLDTLRLHNSKGSLILIFNGQQAAQAHPAGHGAMYYEYAQKLYDATGAYAGTSETGTVKLTTNANRSQLYSITLESRAS
jgi:hypothetical protein